MVDIPQYTPEQQASFDKAVAAARKEARDAEAKKYADYAEMKTKLSEIEAARKAEADKGKSEVEKLMATMAAQDKATKTLKAEIDELRTFKTQADVQKLTTERCLELKLDPAYAKYAQGSTVEEIDTSLQQIHADFGNRTLGAGGGGGEGEAGAASGGGNKAINDYIRTG